MPEGLPIAKGNQDHILLPRMANRHGLIAGATGTGKTVTLRVMAENLSRIGVPVFMADVKGDLSGIAHPGQNNPKIAERVSKLGVKNFQCASYPTVFWDLYGQQGHPVRTTISDMGPLLMSRLLNLLQQSLGRIIEKQVRFIEKEHQLWFLGIADFRQALEELGQHPKQKRGVQFRRVDEFVGGENVDNAASVGVGLHHVVKIERGFAKEVIRALLFERQ